MWKLKYKCRDEEPMAEYFNTLQEVTDAIMFLCDAKNIKNAIDAQNEFNIRFYVSFKKEN